MYNTIGWISADDFLFQQYLGALKAHLDPFGCKCYGNHDQTKAAIRSLKGKYPEASSINIPLSIRQLSKYGGCDCTILAFFTSGGKKNLPTVNISEPYTAPEDRIPDHRWFTDEGLRMMRRGFMKDIGERYR